jgi:hypothetical protein
LDSFLDADSGTVYFFKVTCEFRFNTGQILEVNFDRIQQINQAYERAREEVAS